MQTPQENRTHPPRSMMSSRPVPLSTDAHTEVLLPRSPSEGASNKRSTLRSHSFSRSPLQRKKPRASKAMGELQKAVRGRCTNECQTAGNLRKIVFSYKFGGVTLSASATCGLIIRVRDGHIILLSVSQRSRSSFQCSQDTDLSQSA